MSHHLDTPLAAQTGQLLLDDLCVFPGEESTVFVMDVNSTINGLHSEPSFHPEARYEFKVHFDGAGNEELTYRFSFGEPDADGRQPLRLHELTGGDARDDSAAGELLLAGRTGAVSGDSGVRLWAGRIKDWFYIDLSLLSKVNAAVADGSAVDLSGWRPENATNSFVDTTVDSIVLEVSHRHRRLRPGNRIGVWAATKLATDAGGWRQINRAGHPMMWPIFWPADVRFDQPFDTQHVSLDVESDRAHLAEHIAATVAASRSSADPTGYAETLVRELFPDVLTYTIGTPATYGFAVRNGRTLADNAPEVMLSLVTASAIPSGLSPASNERLRTAEFPYVVPA
ncbi:DUF4331 family protein [Actinoplanes sp. M2I2]|uniref:DUF4331 family protein n=1 Tax=Actinoplanes sp. M2I2 TaxID=1734444 RepID=UPI002020B2B7|nr:DUF4331 family protein [Actinoplanes sp. M2I2]